MNGNWLSGREECVSHYTCYLNTWPTHHLAVNFRADHGSQLHGACQSKHDNQQKGATYVDDTPGRRHDSQPASFGVVRIF